MKKVLVVGSGGREHAIAWKLSCSSKVSKIILAPGNPGMSQDWDRWEFDLNSGPESFQKLAEKAVKENVDLALIGPDNPLAQGIVDVFNRVGVLTFGPTAAAAKIESSKSFAKDVMKSALVPTAHYLLAENKSEAEVILRGLNWPRVDMQRGLPGSNGWVVKADGLALGKGVRLCGTLDDGLEAIEKLPPGKIVIEERLRGEELSWMSFCDGQRIALLEPARDYKRARDGDQGGNTGGMGAYSPIQNVPERWKKRIKEKVFLPVVQELNKRGTPFRGLLFAGLMVDFKKDSFWVLEFNSRFGDPETQVLLPRMKDDLWDWCEGCAKGNISHLQEDVEFQNLYSVCVIAVSSQYPNTSELNFPIIGEVEVRSTAPVLSAHSQPPPHFFAGVAMHEGKLVTAGGRVFGAMGLGEDLDSARHLAYERMHQLQFSGKRFRKDIASGLNKGKV